MYANSTMCEEYDLQTKDGLDVKKFELFDGLLFGWHSISIDLFPSKRRLDVNFIGSYRLTLSYCGHSIR